MLEINDVVNNNIVLLEKYRTVSEFNNTDFRNESC